MVGRTKSYLRRRRRRRMKNKVNISDKCFTLMHSNIRGFNSKVVSLNSILGVIRPDVLTINKTFIKNITNSYFKTLDFYD